LVVNMLTAIGETLLAQIGNPSPETPPLADKLMKMVQYLTWFAILSGIVAIIFAGGKFAWEKWSGSAPQSPKMVAGAMVGGVIATSAGTIMNALVGT
jgi:4-hydroxybenzoate polyprenyltransferase